jgi:hypothetical protein
MSDQQAASQRTAISGPIARWGTRGLIAGCAVGFVFVLVAIVFDMLHDAPFSAKELLGFPIFMGLLGVPCALVGTLIGIAVWICRRT